MTTAQIIARDIIKNGFSLHPSSKGDLQRWTKSITSRKSIKVTIWREDKITIAKFDLDKGSDCLFYAEFTLQTPASAIMAFLAAI